MLFFKVELDVAYLLLLTSQQRVEVTQWTGRSLKQFGVIGCHVQAIGCQKFPEDVSQSNKTRDVSSVGLWELLS